MYLFEILKLTMSNKYIVTDAELGELAAKISSKSLEQIAIRWLDIDMDMVDNERKTCRENQWKFNFNLLRIWNNKNKDKEARRVSIFPNV